jgi:hypothetical protein
MLERGVTRMMVETAIATSEPFEYTHANATKIAYYDAAARILVTVASGTITTVMSSVPAAYVENLKKRTS